MRIRPSEAEQEALAPGRRVAMLEELLTLTAERVAGEAGASPVSEHAAMTLHAAMAKVLSTAPDRMLRAGGIARQIEQPGLYRMRDGRAVEATQIHARVGHYPHLVRKSGSMIELIGRTADRTGGRAMARRRGRDELEWNELVAATTEFLIEQARLQRTTSYTERNAVLVRRTGARPFDFEDSERAAMGQLLGEVAQNNRDEVGAMLPSRRVGGREP